MDAIEFWYTTYTWDGKTAYLQQHNCSMLTLLCMSSLRLPVFQFDFNIDSTEFRYTHRDSVRGNRITARKVIVLCVCVCDSVLRCIAPRNDNEHPFRRPTVVVFESQNACIPRLGCRQPIGRSHELHVAAQVYCVLISIILGYGCRANREHWSNRSIKSQHHRQHHTKQKRSK